MKRIAAVALLLTALLPLSFGQQAGSPLPFAGNAAPFQLGMSYTFTSADTQTVAFNTNGLQYFMLSWTPNGTVSAATITMDGSTGGAFSVGSIISSQDIHLAGGFTTSSASHSVQAKLTPSITGSGSVTVVVYGFSSNPAIMSGTATNVAVTSPVDGSGYVNVDCKTGCASGNPNGSATSANSAPVVIASDQAAVAVKNATAANLKVDPSGVTSPVSLASLPGVAGVAATGATVSGNPVLMGGSDGTNAQAIKTDTSGNQIVVGNVAAGSAAAGNPVQIAAAANGSGNVTRIAAQSTGQLELVAGVAGADGVANTLGLMSDVSGVNRATLVAPEAFNGSTWDRVRTASATNLANSNTIGAMLTEFGPRLAVNSQPAVSTQATASIAAGGAGVRHVFDHVCFSGGSTSAPSLTNLQVNIRDGATGAGTVLASFQVFVPATTGQNVGPFCSPVGANLLGTANTAMTAEFSALLTNEFEQVTLYYYNAN